MRFFLKPSALLLHLNPSGAAMFRFRFGGILGANAFKNAFASLHGMPHAFTRYFFPRRGGALGVWIPQVAQAGPVVLQVVCFPSGIVGIVGGGGSGGGGGAA